MTRLDYCQFLLSSQINYTLTYFADHAQKWSHDTINRYLRGDKVAPRLLWDNVQADLVPHPEGYLLFDDTVLDKRYSRKIEPARRQWSGNAKQVIEGIGLVTCVYVNPDLDRFWIIDYRLYAPETDGKTKIDHLQDMLRHTVEHKELAFSTVLMDSWYATMAIWKLIESFDKLYYCPIKTNRQVSLSPDHAYQRVDSIDWSQEQATCGRLVHIKKMPKGHQVKLYRLVLSSERTDYVITNDVTQDSAEATREVCGVRWKIEQLHRELKQTTGIERCQCRAERIQRNHIGCAILVWVRLRSLAHELGTSIYALKRDLLSDYMVEQLRNPSIQMTLA